MSGPGLQLQSDDPRTKFLNMVRPPAFFLMCVGTLSIFYNVLQVVLFALHIPSPFAQQGTDPSMFTLSWYFVLTVLVGLICGTLSIWGALSAMRLKGYGLATVGAITAIFPTFPVCFAATPVAVWMLFTLRREGVRQAFSP
ncbi:hypothetical protein JGU66_26455 [Myxococcaceae bacterium JPH2]|nr:hypothetical protein [Myxococcaceae bacterium JPH2]